MRIRHYFAILLLACAGCTGLVVALAVRGARSVKYAEQVRYEAVLRAQEGLRCRELTGQYFTTLDLVLSGGNSYLIANARAQSELVLELIDSLESGSSVPPKSIAFVREAIDELNAGLDGVATEGVDGKAGLELVNRLDELSIDLIDELDLLEGRLAEDTRKAQLVVEEERLSAWRRLLRAAVLVGLLVLALWRWSERSLLRPLSRLTASSVDAARDDKVIDALDSGPKEVVQLSRAMNAFSLGFRTSQETLEARVQERTRQLEEANRKLEEDLKLRLQLEAELRHAEKLRAVGQLAAGIAHEINTPVPSTSATVCTSCESAYDDLAGTLHGLGTSRTAGGRCRIHSAVEGGSARAHRGGQRKKRIVELLTEEHVAQARLSAVPGWTRARVASDRAGDEGVRAPGTRTSRKSPADLNQALREYR